MLLLLGGCAAWLGCLSPLPHTPWQGQSPLCAALAPLHREENFIKGVLKLRMLRWFLVATFLLTEKREAQLPKNTSEIHIL